MTEKVKLEDLHDNFFRAIGTEWMLVTAGEPTKFNTMTASWGGIGWLWNKPVAYIFIRPERYTAQFIEASDKVMLSFLGTSDDARKIHQVCGHKSGRDIDKAKEAGLKTIVTETGGITYEQARLSLECRKLYAADLNKAAFVDKSILEHWYKEPAQLHKMYIMEIDSAWISK